MSKHHMQFARAEISLVVISADLSPDAVALAYLRAVDDLHYQTDRPENWGQWHDLADAHDAELALDRATDRLHEATSELAATIRRTGKRAMMTHHGICIDRSEGGRDRVDVIRPTELAFIGRDAN